MESRFLRRIRILNTWCCPGLIVSALLLMGCPDPRWHIALEKPSGGTTRRLTIEPEKDVEVEIRGSGWFRNRARLYELRLSVRIKVKKEFSNISNVRERMSVEFHSLPMKLDTLYEYSYDSLTENGFKMLARFVINYDTYGLPSVVDESYDGGALQIHLDSAFVIDGKLIRIAPITGREEKSGYYY